MVTTINNGISPATGPAGAAPSAPVSSPTSVSAGAIGGGFVPTALFELSMPTADAGASGMRAPLNPEDAGALLLLAEATLDQTNARTHAASLESRFGAAAVDGATVNQRVRGKQAVLQDAQTVAKIQKQIDDAPSGTDTSQLQLQLTAAEAALSQAQAAIGVTPSVADPSKTAEDNDLDAVADAQSDLDDQVGTAITALSQIAIGLRSDVGKDADQTNQTTQRRVIAYRDVGDTARHFRDGEVTRVRHDGQTAADRQAQAVQGRQADMAQGRQAEAARGRQTEAARGAAAPGKDRGTALATRLAAAVADAQAVLQAFVAAPQPAVSPTAAVESGGRVRLSL